MLLVYFGFFSENSEAKQVKKDDFIKIVPRETFKGKVDGTRMSFFGCRGLPKSMAETTSRVSNPKYTRTYLIFYWFKLTASQKLRPHSRRFIRPQLDSEGSIDTE